ncbi:MAG: dihydroorotase [Legionellales bacterium]|nr:dihydroorotase [Legionellales bacterium]|tara:strand:+ start:58050 stop:59081 length:1032 start_codon:yes stop_codon:yes gene_type:complete
MQKITLTKPDDWHVHFRDNLYLALTVPHSAAQFGRAIAMPNLVPPVTTVGQAQDYLVRLREHSPAGFTPLMTLYLTDNTTPADIEAAANSDFVHGCKLYPAGATTNSDNGVTDISKLSATLAAMEEHGILLLVHGEVTHSDVDVFDREARFIETTLEPLVKQFPRLKVVLEHITTKDAVDFVQQGPATLAATITPHHLWLNRNDLLVGGIKPHHYCLPIVKRHSHQQALIKAATSGNPTFFLGTDSAPHTRANKENACGCAGIYSAHAAIELYAEVFEHAGALDKLEAFASHHGADFYGLPRNTATITLAKQPWTVPEVYTYGNEVLVPFMAGQNLQWKIINE